MRMRFHQHPNRSEGPCGYRRRKKLWKKHKVPPAYSQADERACSLTALGMTVFKKMMIFNHSGRMSAGRSWPKLR
jgi:hypothetical protein